MTAQEVTEHYKITPMAGRVIVKIYDKERLSKGGIWMPETSSIVNQRPILGEVVEVCEDYNLDGVDFEPIFAKGDIVVFGQFSGSEIQVNRDKLLIIREKDILCKITSEVGITKLEEVLKLHERD